MNYILDDQTVDSVELLLYITPPEQHAVIDRYFSMGASRIACCLEVWDDRLAERITPGKRSFTTKQRHLDALTYIAEKYGPGKAFSNFIIGLEPPETLTQEDVFQFIADAAAGVAHSINTLISQGFCDHFTEQQLGVIAMCGNVGQEKNTPRSTHADAVREGCILYRTVKLRGAEVTPGQSTDAGGIAPHQNDAVAGMFCIGHQSSDFTGQPGCGTCSWNGSAPPQ